MEGNDRTRCAPPAARKPDVIDPLAQRILDRLSKHAEAGQIVLGGYFAMQHYLEYRNTHDIDAWWRTRADAATEAVIREAMTGVAAEEGLEFRERRFGETLSFELRRAGRRCFSFQIAVRSVELEPPTASAWPPIQIETLQDNLGAKMNALVDRGAPRDFTDVMHVVKAGLADTARCWELWSRKNPGQPVSAARDKVLHHLAELASRRPVDSIADPSERQRARDTREWYRLEFLRAGE
ncbi:MAG: nucleotidyl transferase AbiEii/AbiGii toxin family protein [Phycisphaerales bacterium]|nr:nucleotidyl transferase AbiEii/AbiGii toxin family protein [Phycisphaerales bacterium]